METSDSTVTPTAALRVGSSLRKWVLLSVIFLAGCSTDLATKAMAASSLKSQPPITLIPHLLEFRYAENPAIAFSMLSGMAENVRAPLILGFSAIAFFFLFWMIWDSRSLSAGKLLPLIFILSGAVGNITDRLRHGYVVDFIHVHWKDVWSYPIFNVADSLIFIGIVLYLLQVWRAPRAQPAPG